MKFLVRPVVVSSLLAAIMLTVPLPATAQSPESSSPGITLTSPETDADHEKIWNSPEMLEARAHLELMFKRSAKITEEQAAKYMADLKAMSPDQMQIWLFQHQAQRAEVQQEESRSASLRRGVARGNLPAQNVGAFRNPVANRGNVSSGQPVASIPPNQQRQAVQKPFSGPQFSSGSRPLVTSQEAARFEVLRGFGSWSIY